MMNLDGEKNGENSQSRTKVALGLDTGFGYGNTNLL